jgi:cyclase
VARSVDGLKGSRHFTLENVGEGVYGAIATQDGLAVGNAGIVDLGDSTVIFDTFSSHIAAADLKSVAERMTGRAVDTVVLSHAHRDHTKGSQAFDGASILSTAKTLENMARRLEARTEKVRREGLAAIEKEVNVEFDAWISNPATDPSDKAIWESYRQSLLQGIEDYRIVVPNIGFESSVTLCGNRRKAQALTFGTGHSESDALLYLPEERTVFMGDLLFIGYQPYIGDGDLQGLLRTLDKVEALDARILVPGHGPIGVPADISKMRDYLDAAQKEVDAVRRGGGGVDEVRRRSLPPALQGLRWRAFWPENLEALYKQMTERET